MTSILQQKTISPGSGDWTATVPFNQLDPSAGIFGDALITTAGTIDTSASIENLAPVAASVYLGVTATIVATMPDIGVVGSVVAGAGAAVNLGAFQGTFDGSLDFGGPSGTVVPDITGSQTQTVIVAPGTATASPFVGTGTFDAAVTSYATSTVYGNGNLAVLLNSSVSADLSLQYDVANPGSNGGGNNDSAASTLIDIFSAPFVNLATTAPQVVTLPSQTTGWTALAAFHQFDPSLGSLVEIVLNAGNAVAGTFLAGNLEGAPVSVNMTETAGMTVSTPVDSAAVTSSAASFDNMALAASNGMPNYVGGSGQSDTVAGSPLSQTDGSTTLADYADLAAFTGTGTIDLPVSTAGTSTVTGPSNLFFELTQHTGGTVSVSYVYATPGATSDIIPIIPPSLLGGGYNSASSPTTGSWAATAPRMTFVAGPTSFGAAATGYLGDARPGETFLIQPGANATIDDFSLTAGEKLNLTGLLAGASMAPDLSNLGLFVSANAHAADPAGGVDTTLSIRGPGGAARLTLVNSNPIAVADLLNDNALILPPH